MHILLFGGSFDPPHLGHLLVIEQAFELIQGIDELWLLPTYHHTFGKQSIDPIHRLNMCRMLVSEAGRQGVWQQMHEPKSMFVKLRQLQNPDRSRTPLAGVEDGNFVTKQNVLKLCPIEIDFQTSGSTYDTLQLLRTKHQYIEKMFDNVQLPITNYQPQPKNLKIENSKLKYSFLMGSDQLPAFESWQNWQKLLEEMHFYVYPRGSHRYPVTYPNMTLLESTTQIITNISSTIIRERIRQKLPISRLLTPAINTYIQEQGLYN